MIFTDCPANFQPRQILCLPDQADRLYVEVIQVAEARQMCWVRPLVLVVANLTVEQYQDLPVVDEAIDSLHTLYDLRQSADLLWSSRHFRIALDTEVIPVLAHLGDVKLQPEGDRLARQQLQEFMQRVWQTQADKT
jgi:hypothetical protein